MLNLDPDHLFKFYLENKRIKRLVFMVLTFFLDPTLEQSTDLNAQCTSKLCLLISSIYLAIWVTGG